MEQPTREQAGRFWEWCGFTIEDRASTPGGRVVLSHCRYPSGHRGYIPVVSLNNLFKWAVPSLKDSCEEWWDVIVEWAKDITGNYEKDTLALFWEIRNAFNKEVKE